MKIEIEIPDAMAPEVQKVEARLGMPVAEVLRRGVIATVNLYHTKPFALLQAFGLLRNTEAGRYITNAVTQ